jgi:YfiH family protein
VHKNLEILSRHLGIVSSDVIFPYQVHGCEVREIDHSFLELSREQKQHFLNGIDALFTRLPGVVIGVTTADCVPLLFYAPEKKVIAAVHAGWRGTCAGIAAKIVKTLVEKFDLSPENIFVAAGPSISPSVYEVGDNVVEEFQNNHWNLSEVFSENDGKIFLNLWKANEISLLESKLKKENIQFIRRCTFTESENFFSARRQGIQCGRMLSGIMLKQV